MNSDIKAIVFDVGNVLAHFSMDGLAQYLLSCGAQFNSIEEFRDLIPIWEYERGEMSTEEFFQGVQEVCPKPLDFEKARHLWIDIFTPNTELLNLANQLSSTCTIGILSNTSVLHWEYLLDNYRLDEFATVLMPSFQLGYMKPEMEIYKIAEELLGATGSEILFFDDRIENIEGAKKMGWRAIHYQHLSDALGVLQA